MAVAVNDIVDKVAQILNDLGVTRRWPTAELIGWLNDAQKAIVMYKPETGTLNSNIQLVSGSKQTIPTGGLSLVSVVRNMGAVGSTPGIPITRVGRDLLDATTPAWHNTSGTEVKHYVYNPRDPKVFYVYPQCTDYVEIEFISIPTIVGEGGNIVVDDIYEPAIVDYVCHRALQKDAEFNNKGKVYEFKQAFLMDIGALKNIEEGG